MQIVNYKQVQALYLVTVCHTSHTTHDAQYVVVQGEHLDLVLPCFIILGGNLERSVIDTAEVAGA